MKILAVVDFKEGNMLVNNTPWQFARNPGNTVLKDLYLALGMNYPKLFKMDALSRLCVLTTEVLAEIGQVRPLLTNRCAIVLANRGSSLDIDQTYLNGLNETGMGSPAQFVYTLPNVMIGEICIRYQMHCPTEMYVMPTFDTHFLRQQAQWHFSQNRAEHALVGWVDVMGQNMEAHITMFAK